MKAVVHERQSGMDGLHYRNMEQMEPKEGEVKVKLKTAGLNHRDIFLLERHKPTEPPIILGSDGAGIVETAGQGVENVKIGDEVIINPSIGWKHNSEAPPEGFNVLGYPDHGTFAEYIIISADNVELKPAYLSWEEAGVLSLAALTAYRALFTRGHLRAGSTVLIPGIGSGVATFLLQFAKAAGAAVYVTSRSKDKCEKALELGADKAIDSNEDWNKQLNNEKVDIVIECVGAATFNKSFDQVRRGGTVVTFGASAGDKVEIDIRKFFYGQYNLLGTTMGSAEEYREMLEFIQKHQIKPVLDQIYPIEQFQEGFYRMEKGAQLGKIGFDINT
ncbi:zinc-binding dehydrogenase [Alteribacillus sp. YIM 98480]|uniref:zinc-binding dehydrogenase n=1 Tax=Alteribacillus sp. YIM 98480 TaxID=2606599 RepID=UPI00131DE80D|nr:zinc-binding dehydrogenase [Alteribacillus sp. YIM 98480]